MSNRRAPTWRMLQPARVVSAILSREDLPVLDRPILRQSPTGGNALVRDRAGLGLPPSLPFFFPISEEKASCFCFAPARAGRHNGIGILTVEQQHNSLIS